jgi:hypothetical protein
MKQEKLFTVAGTSNLNGEVKVRFGNDLVARIKVLHSRGNTDVNLIELPSPMTKLDALLYLQTAGHAVGDAGVIIAAKVAEKSKAAKSGEMTIKGTKPESVAKSNTSVETV